MNKKPDTRVTAPGQLISGSGGEPLTVGDIRNAIANIDNSVEIDFGCTESGKPLIFYRMKWRDKSLLQFELNEAD